MSLNMLFFGIPEGAKSATASQNYMDSDDSTLERPSPLISEIVSGQVSNTDSNDLVTDHSTFNNSTPFLPNKPVTENCINKVYDFCSQVLNISGPETKIAVDVAHRIGAFTPGKIRPIVVRFKDKESKFMLKQQLRKVNLRNSPFNVSDQFPQEVMDRRRALIPEMIKARGAGKRAVLVRDKLFIDNKLFKPGTSINTKGSS
jgi:hypothetical protein